MSAQKRNEEFWLAQMGLYETLDITGVSQEESINMKRLISAGLIRQTVSANRRSLTGKWSIEEVDMHQWN